MIYTKAVEESVMEHLNSIRNELIFHEQTPDMRPAKVTVIDWELKRPIFSAWYKTKLDNVKEKWKINDVSSKFCKK